MDLAGGEGKRRLRRIDGRFMALACGAIQIDTVISASLNSVISAQLNSVIPAQAGIQFDAALPISSAYVLDSRLRGNDGIPRK